MAQVNAGLTHHEAMRAIFERFFRRSPEHGYSWAEFEADALTILDAASLRSTSRDSEDDPDSPQWEALQGLRRRPLDEGSPPMSDIAQRAPNTFYLAGYVGTSFEVVHGVLQTFEVPSEVVQALEARSTRRDSEVREAAKAVLDHAETDDGFEGEFIDWLVPHDDIERLRAALGRSSEASA